MKKDNIVSYTNSKVIIKWDRLNEVLTKEEKLFMNKLLGKIEAHQKENPRS